MVIDTIGFNDTNWLDINGRFHSENLTLNAKDQVEKVETVNGNAVTITTYSDYMYLGEIKSDALFPLHMVQAEKDGRRVFELTISKADMNNPYVVFPVPDNVGKNQRD